MKGLIFSIEEFSVYDGPGIRTAVFFKGCPLRCNWCHNPEGWEMKEQIVRSPNGCIRCGKCYEEAEKHGGRLTRECIDLCPRNLIRESGRWYDVEELSAKLLKNAGLLAQAGGGITFSGGECLMQIDFLTEIAKALKGKVHLAIETSGYGDSEKFRTLLKYLDLVMYDLKLVDAERFREYIGGDNEVVLRNFRILGESGVTFIPRTPLIPGITDTPDNLESIAALVAGTGADHVELLPYNKMAGSKYKLIGKRYEPVFDESVAPNA
ncbi:MAG: glycyl-radical enzyme activating protein, partial [Candidatus Gallimonas sp.]